MADFEKAIPIILKHEGGFVDHPSDPGGATNRGIIFSLFKQYAKALGLLPTVDALKSLTEDQAKFIYREHFWDRMLGDQFKDQQVANIVFDAYVNCGGSGLKLIQKEVGVDVDGVIGPNTIAIINDANPHLLFDGFKDARKDYYIRLAERKPKLKVFLKGWLNRVEAFKYDLVVV
jgi:lysozyme family protein